MSLGVCFKVSILIPFPASASSLWIKTRAISCSYYHAFALPSWALPSETISHKLMLSVINDLGQLSYHSNREVTKTVSICDSAALFQTGTAILPQSLFGVWDENSFSLQQYFILYKVRIVLELIL